MSSQDAKTALFSTEVPLNVPASTGRSPMLFLNIPISDLAASIAFYTAIGFVPNKTFGDSTSIMMSLPPLYPSSQLPHTSPDNRCGTINLMIMTRERFSGFLPKADEHKRDVVDASKAAQGLFCLSCGSVEEVDAWVDRAVKAGGKKATGIEPEGESALMQHFADTEGNWVGLYTMKK